ncbi:hypothetical protein [Actinoplanes sp. NPDC020271]|uniref:hypothetical protein n=1 Tax=Actinoplanes sp. NPDC020271 TaxID=3363896 RepID=UPI00378D00DF
MASSRGPATTGGTEDPVVWRPLADSPPVRRTRAVWSADSRRRDVATLIAHLVPARPGDGPG